MIRKLILFAITSGLAAKAYSAYSNKRDAKAPNTSATPNGNQRCG